MINRQELIRKLEDEIDISNYFEDLNIINEILRDTFGSNLEFMLYENVISGSSSLQCTYYSQKIKKEIKIENDAFLSDVSYEKLSDSIIKYDKEAVNLERNIIRKYAR